ncbi:MAG: hypothetical protein IJU16_01465 [Clostridia bacterium]|nr:hypothetical protein [Clostridia bacterium]
MRLTAGRKDLAWMALSITLQGVYAINNEGMKEYKAKIPPTLSTGFLLWWTITDSNR